MQEGLLCKEIKITRKITVKTCTDKFYNKELDALMKQCGCEKFEGGRGSGIGYYHVETKRILQFDGPHPGNELYRYHVKMVIVFLKEVGEIE